MRARAPTKLFDKTVHAHMQNGFIYAYTIQNRPCAQTQTRKPKNVQQMIRKLL